MTMTVLLQRYRHWPLIEHKCCGHLWQLLLSPKFPERYDFHPICPDCGEVGKSYRETIKEAAHD